VPPILRILATLLALSPAAVLADDADIVAAARRQVGVTVHYDPAYRKLEFPGGDVPPERGVCTDVVVRALRGARAMDLQALVNADLRAHWNAYPHPLKWRLSKPDSNIDHRRVPNLMTFFERAGWSRPVSRRAADYLPGDVVAWDLGRGLLHIGIVGDVGIIGHYRPPPAVATR
jgi:uncharacterized protein YijF (DUF1287 family)